MSVPTTTTFKTAAPYGILALGVGAVGAAIAVGCAATALKIAGVVLAVIGAYSFFAIAICGFMNAGKPQNFKKELPHYLGTVVGGAIADIIKRIAIEVISGLLDKALGRQGTSFRMAGI